MCIRDRINLILGKVTCPTRLNPLIANSRCLRDIAELLGTPEHTGYRTDIAIDTIVPKSMLTRLSVVSIMLEVSNKIINMQGVKVCEIPILVITKLTEVAKLF